MSGEYMKAVMKELEETMLLLDDIEVEPSSRIRDRTQLQIQAEKARMRTDANMAEIRKNYNALIGYIAGQKSERPNE